MADQITREEFSDCMESFEHRLAARLTRVERRLDGIDGRFDPLDIRLEAIDTRLDVIDERLAGAPPPPGGIAIASAGVSDEALAAIDALSRYERHFEEFMRRFAVYLEQLELTAGAGDPSMAVDLRSQDAAAVPPSADTDPAAAAAHMGTTPAAATRPAENDPGIVRKANGARVNGPALRRSTRSERAAESAARGLRRGPSDAAPAKSAQRRRRT
jgi:hypothetical protein